MFPNENFILVSKHHHTADIKCGNILIEIKNSATGMSKKNISKLEKDISIQHAPLAIMILFYDKSTINLAKRIFFLNIKDIYVYKDILSSLFEKYKNYKLNKETYGDIKYLLTNIESIVNPSINSQRSKKYAELLSNKENIIKNLEERQNICNEKEHEINRVQSLATKYSKQSFIDKIDDLNISERRKNDYKNLIITGRFLELPKYLLK